MFGEKPCRHSILSPHITKVQEVQRDKCPGKDRVSGSSQDAQVGRPGRSHECGKAPEVGEASGAGEEAPGSTSSTAGLHVLSFGKL